MMMVIGGDANDLVDWWFASLQHLRSYHGGYQLVAVHTHGDLIVLLHWEIRLATL